MTLSFFTSGRSVLEWGCNCNKDCEHYPIQKNINYEHCEMLTSNAVIQNDTNSVPICVIQLRSITKNATSRLTIDQIAQLARPWLATVTCIAGSQLK